MSSVNHLSKASNDTNNISKVIVHPLVLLSVVDHYSRLSKGNGSKRVVGVLLGYMRKDILEITNSFAGNCLVLIWLVSLSHFSSFRRRYGR